MDLRCTAICLLIVCIAGYFAYHNAKESGRNGALWASATIAIGVGFQVVIPVTVGGIAGFVFFSNVNESSVEEFGKRFGGILAVVRIVTLLLSFVGMWLVLRRAATPLRFDAVEPPPPPPKFDRKDGFDETI